MIPDFPHNIFQSQDTTKKNNVTNLIFFYEVCLVSSNLNSNWFHSAHPNIHISMAAILETNGRMRTIMKLHDFMNLPLVSKTDFS